MEGNLNKQGMLHCFVKKYFFIFFLFSLTLNCYGQLTRADKKLFFKADNALDYGDFLSALTIYKQLRAKDSTIQELNYKIGVCMFELKKFRPESKRYFEMVSANKFPEANYYLGRLSHLERKYDQAIEYYARYTLTSSENEHSNEETDALAAKCNTAILLEAKADSEMLIRNLGSSVNTEYAEYAPLLPAEGNFMVFTSRRKNDVFPAKDPLGDYFEDIYVAFRKADTWQPAKMLDTTINTYLHDAGTGLSADGEKLLLYRTSKDLKSGDIYQSDFVNRKWSKPVMVGPIVNSPEYLETSACYSPDGQTIYFSSNRPGGYGGKDIYAVKKLPGGEWGKPFNLGPSVNTKFNEDAPFVHPIDKVLFFSSEGHRNMGGYDIFKSTYDDRGIYDIAENMGSPINTVDDDIFFVMNTDATMGYFSSQRDGGYGSQDIYSVYLPESNNHMNVYNIYVYDETGVPLKQTEILLTDMEKKSVYGVYKANETSGKTMVISQPGREFRIAIQANGFEPFIGHISLASESEITFKLSKKNQ
jgi:hypothetical protein